MSQKRYINSWGISGKELTSQIKKLFQNTQAAQAVFTLFVDFAIDKYLNIQFQLGTQLDGKNLAQIISETTQKGVKFQEHTETFISLASERERSEFDDYRQMTILNTKVDKPHLPRVLVILQKVTTATCVRVQAFCSCFLMVIPTQQSIVGVVYQLNKDQNELEKRKCKRYCCGMY
eukprot:TRINITY_DN2363_c0_g1_i2.p5 TRINITY_DN2363_c0_g1~~TRINITY_DN2363_c0_g1_i2.p5  ORF type:complete len:176 (-),score=9.84 TRINITY_DN2363_c0_g1_i2:600-1127(-)